MTKQVVLNLSLIIIFFVSYSNAGNAQCIISGGSDVHWCRNFGSTDTVQFNSNIVAGVGPYQFTWYMDPIIFSSSLKFYASDYLSDTTSPNPKIIGSQGYEMIFYLEVTDAIGYKCKDTVKLTTSRFAENFNQYYYNIIEGDSVQLKPPNVGLIYGKPSIDSVVWRPNEGLNDSNAVRPWAKPKRDVIYRCEVYDSAGCSQEGSPYQFVFVSNLNNDTDPVKGLNVYPNILTAFETNTLSIEAPEGINNLKFTLYDISGSVLFTKENVQYRQNSKVSLPALKSGLYYLQMSTTLEKSSKIIKIVIKH